MGKETEILDASLGGDETEKLAVTGEQMSAIIDDSDWWPAPSPSSQPPASVVTLTSADVRPLEDFSCVPSGTRETFIAQSWEEIESTPESESALSISALVGIGVGAMVGMAGVGVIAVVAGRRFLAAENLTGSEKDGYDNGSFPNMVELELCDESAQTRPQVEK
jgi:hypothetical protein